jgi:hypothetical protein
MKATPSKDGKLRFNVVVRHRVGFEQMFDAFSLAFDGEDITAVTSRVHGMKVVRRELADAGLNLWAHAEDCSGQSRDKARAAIERWFPELL